MNLVENLESLQYLLQNNLVELSNQEFVELNKLVNNIISRTNHQRLVNQTEKDKQVANALFPIYYDLMYS